MTFILAPKIPDLACIMLDNCSIKWPATRYKSPDGSLKVLADNPGIRRFIWEHLRDVHCILYQLLCAGATVSAPKLALAVPEVIILRHKCNYQGCIPDDSKIVKIQDWLPCKTITDVCTFLGITGYSICVSGSATTPPSPTLSSFSPTRASLSPGWRSKTWRCRC